MRAVPVRKIVRRVLPFLFVAQVLALAGHAQIATTVRATLVAARSMMPSPVAHAFGARSSTTSSADPASDTTPPEIAPVTSVPAAATGWWTSDVTLSWTVTDPESDVTSSAGCDTVSITSDTTSTTYTCTATSTGGTSEKSIEIKRDATKPYDVAVAPDREPDANGYYNHAFTATWTGKDDTSGLPADGCTVQTYSTPDTNDGTLSGICTDAAGNASDTVTFSFKYDGTAPSVTGTPSRAPDFNGWYNAPFTVSWSGGEGATCDDPTDYPNASVTSPDSATASVTGSCTDEAGNTAQGTFAFQYDATAPEISATVPADGDPVYLLHQSIDAAYACTDATSGVGSCTAPVADGSALDTSTVGAHAFPIGAQDQAGNTASLDRPYAVQYAPVGPCGGVTGHQVLSPLSPGVNTVQHNSTVPVKFRVCDANGTSITTPGVVSSFRLVSVDGDTSDAAVTATNGKEFRSGDQQWIFNLSTKPYAAGHTYTFAIALNDGTQIGFSLAVR